MYFANYDMIHYLQLNYEMTSTALGEVLGTAPSLNDLIKQIPLRALRSRADKKGLINCPLANLREKLKTDVRTMDNQMKVWIGITIQYLNKRLSGEKLCSDNVIAVLQTNPVLEPDGEGIFNKDSVDFGSELALFNDNGTPNPDDHKCE